MKIAVVGGGAAGVAATHLLAPHHRVTLYEKAPILGGHIRTVGGNIAANGPAAAAFDPARPLEAGVVEFDRASFVYFTALMADLDVELRPVPVFTSLYRPDGAWHSPGLLRAADRPWPWRLRGIARALTLAAAHRRFDKRAAAADPRALDRQTMAEWLPPGPLGDWIRALMTYAWSVPYPETRAVPAAFALPVQRHFLCDALEWVRIVGGASTWIDRAVDRAERHGAEIRRSTAIDAICRSHDGIVIESSDGIWHHDAVVIATSPGQIRRLLADADGDERRRFGAWTDHDTHTLVHRDPGLFERRGVEAPTAFDLFVDDGRGGYNALLDDLCGYDRGAAYGLSLGIDHLIEPARVIHRQSHRVPRYTVDAICHRRDVIEHNGHRKTWIAGAWLGDGLHEGAIASAARVAAALGGRRLVPIA